jgi:hypothetical protein
VEKRIRERLEEIRRRRAAAKPSTTKGAKDDSKK